MLITQFDKNTIEDLGLIKIDLLSLRTLSAVSDVVQQLPELNYNQIPTDDAATFARLQRGIPWAFSNWKVRPKGASSPAFRRTAEDIVASVALIRPGPIKGNMVDPSSPAAAGGKR